MEGLWRALLRHYGGNYRGLNGGTMKVLWRAI